MNFKFPICLLTIASLAACQSTTTAKRETLREMNTRYASNQTAAGNLNEPAPPAEGPEDVSPDGLDPVHNPALLPSPLLRQNAAGGP
jgi:hypothetical protein